MSFGLKLRKSDILYSLWLRTKHNWICEQCGAKHPPKSKGIQCSHFWGRGNESTRFDEKNTDCLCAGCHSFFEANPAAYTQWKLKKLGEKEYDLLELRRNTYQKRDDKLQEIICYKLLKDVGINMEPKKKKFTPCQHKMNPEWCALCLPRKKDKPKKK